LTGQTPYALEKYLSVLGRSLTVQPAAEAVRNDSSQERTYQFAHDTLRALAEQELGSPALARYREQLNTWADTLAAAGWPIGTSQYFVTRYPRMLTATGDTLRISVMARDQRRHAFLQRSTDTDYALLSEINAALRLLVTSALPDL